MFIEHQINTRQNIGFKNTILVAEGFDREWLEIIFDMAYRYGEELDLVTLSRGVSYNAGGNLLLSPSLMLGEILETTTPQLLIIPEGEHCFMQLLVDPRVHQLISRTAASNGMIAMSAGAELMLSRLSPRYRIPRSQLFFQKNLKPTEFARQIFSK